MNVAELYERLRRGDRVALARAITLTESRNTDHRAMAAELLDHCVQHVDDTFRFCVSGAPGVGKSTLIERLGKKIVQDGEKLAVLAIDPSSRISHGAILGDKTRMPDLARNTDVFVRPSPAGEALGGVADRTREAIALCEAGGYGVICVETVGVGQSETLAGSMTDFFLLLVLPGAGDDLQGVKRGIVEMADLIAITKADGESSKLADETRRNYMQAVHLSVTKAHGQKVEVRTCSALEDTGITELWSAMCDFRSATLDSGYLREHRAEQNLQWLETSLNQLAHEILLSSPAVQEVYRTLREQIRSRQISMSAARGKLEQVIRHKFSNGS